MRSSTEMLALLCLIAPAGVAAAACKLARMADLPVTMVGLRPEVHAQINGRDARFIVDSGALYSALNPATAEQYALRLTPIPGNFRITGLGGSSASVSLTTVKEFTLAGYALKNMEFLVGGTDVGSGAVGVIGQNILRAGDVEYDLAKGVIRLMRTEDCKRTVLAYWVGKGLTYSMMDIESTTPLYPHTTGVAYVNGAKIRVMFDTGAPTSILSLKAARQAGVTPETAGVTNAGYTYGVGRSLTKTWIAPFASFKLGDGEEIRNTRLRIGDIDLNYADMLIGADFFLSHHVYVASSQRKLYFTYNGGAVFNLSASPQVNPAAEAREASPAEASADGASPADPAEFSRRGMAYAARKEFALAVADLTRACELAPLEPQYFYQRALVHRQNKEPVLAMADLDQAIKLKPDHVSALVARASDAQLVDALNGRCWARALQGRELAQALGDCNSAFRLAPDASPISAHVLDSRGLTYLRLGQYDRSVADYNAALKLRPTMASSLYGRGVAHMRQKRNFDGQADIDAAMALSPRVAGEFNGHGIVP